MMTSEEVEIAMIVLDTAVEQAAECGICKSYMSLKRFLGFAEEWYLQFDCFFVIDNINVIRNQLISKKIPVEKIYVHGNICRFLCPEQKMKFLEEALYQRDQKKYAGKYVTVGKFTYGVPAIRFCANEREAVKIGSFCSIAGGVTIFGGGEHRPDWMSTYPFNVYFGEDFREINGHPATKGNVVIGNDVWIGSGATILSGVTIGDGAVIGANALVANDVPAYAVSAGNPAKVIRYRFSEETIEKLQKMEWWNWEDALIYEAIPLLQNGEIDRLWEFYLMHKSQAPQEL